MKLEISIEKLKGYSLFVGVPMYGGQCAGAFCAATNELAEMCGKYGLKVRFFYLFNESLVQRARNYIADEFLRSDATHLMFIDSDIGFSAKDVIILWHLQTTYPEQYDILTAPYTKKLIDWEKITEVVNSGIVKQSSDLPWYAGDFAINMKEGTKEFKIDEPVEVLESGTGFMMIPKQVLEKYAKAYPEKSYKPDHLRQKNFNGKNEITAFFDCGIDPETKRYLSEDYYFCQQAQKVGIKLHMCPWIHLNHIGSYTYKGSLTALAQLNAASNTKTLTKDKKRVKINR